ncbi:MAG: HAMP domain-containing protein [Deltaproteobacteria bacterium]|nr:HAMP domain-containing protein [Deltaproteobacteria bacterium]MBW2362551.1 HAMP domain-containing protein [Deltaproteobacteria bacterium]
MRSLQVKFSALLVTLLVVACISLALVATEHERGALESEVEKRGAALASSLAGAAKEPLLAIQQGAFDDELTLDRLVEEIGAGHGVVGARLLGRDGEPLATLRPIEGAAPVSLTEDDGEPTTQTVRNGNHLLVATAVVYSGLRIGEAQVELDLEQLVQPVVERTTRQLSFIAIALILFGVVAGVIFVALLVGPLRRLRLGVEQLRDGDLSVRVPPTSHDEVGELTRAFNEMGDSLEQKQRVQNAFGRYVNDYVLNQLLEGPEEDSLAGMEREVSILFCDIRGFTHLSEDMKARDVVALLHEIFQLVSDRILENGGTIDKFIGDSVMAYFGAPMQQSDHPTRAVNAAVDILATLEARNAAIGTGDEPEDRRVELGIGIHTGMVVVGNIGSDRRTDYTAVGDPVNVAHRLEKLARPGEILVSEAIQRVVRTERRLRFEGERQLSGREEPVHVYSVELEQPGDDARPSAA